VIWPMNKLTELFRSIYPQKPIKPESEYEEEAKARYKGRLMAGESVEAYNEAVGILHRVLDERGLFDVYYTIYPDGTMGCGNLGSFWYVELRYRAAQIWEDHGAAAAEQYIRAQLAEILR
jgi:hypothetical protein